MIAVANTGQVSLLPLVYKLRAQISRSTEKAFDAEGKHFAAGSLLITDAADDQVDERRCMTWRSMATRLSVGASGAVACGHCAAHRLHAYMARDADGRLVALRVRQRRRSIRLHQHADGRRRKPIFVRSTM